MNGYIDSIGDLDSFIEAVRERRKLIDETVTTDGIDYGLPCARGG
jgi:hypothetical protein